MNPESLLQIAYILVGIGAIIFVHELGHFLTAKFSKVRVEGFSLGFPPTGIAFRRRLKGLEVSFLPLFFRKPAPEVGGVEEGSPADTAGLKVGDRFEEINGAKAGLLDYEGLSRLAGSSIEPVRLNVSRAGKEIELSVDRLAGRSGLESIGVFPNLTAQAGLVKSNGPSWAHGLTPEEKVLAASGREFASRPEFVEFVGEAVARGAGLVRLSIAGSEGGETRRIALAVRPSSMEPALSVILPILGGVDGETSYRLSLLPVGGYVKMAGDVPQDVHGKDDEFLRKSVGARALIFGAGSVMNIFFAMICFILAYQVGVQSVSPEVGALWPGYPGEEAGLKRGDRIVSLNGTVIADFWDIPQEVAYTHPDTGLRFTVERGRETIVLPPEDKPAVKMKFDDEQKRNIAGIDPVYTNVVEKMAKNSPFYAAGVRPRDSILTVDGIETPDGMSLGRAFSATLAKGVRKFGIRIAGPDGKEREAEVSLPEDAKKVWRFGIHVAWVVKAAAVSAGGPLKEGDVLEGIEDGAAIFDSGVAEALREFASGRGFPLKAGLSVSRGGERVFVPLEFRSEADIDTFASSVALDSSIMVTAILDRSNFAAAGIPVKSMIRKVGGKPVTTQKALFETLDSGAGEPVDIEYVSPDGATSTAAVKPVPTFTVGIREMGVSVREKREYLRLGFFASIAIGARKSIKFATDVFRTLKGIAQGNIGSENLGGPVMIIYASYRFAEYGLGKLLFFLGIISINLGIINLFPIPILDGGHLVFLLIEKIKGSPLSETMQALAQYAGLLLLLMLMIYVTFNDINRFFF